MPTTVFIIFTFVLRAECLQDVWNVDPGRLLWIDVETRFGLASFCHGQHTKRSAKSPSMAIFLTISLISECLGPKREHTERLRHYLQHWRERSYGEVGLGIFKSNNHLARKSSQPSLPKPPPHCSTSQELTPTPSSPRIAIQQNRQISGTYTSSLLNDPHIDPELLSWRSV